MRRSEKRCKICGCLDDVREDGICRGCYDARCATAAGMSYGQWIAKHGSNFRRGARQAPAVKTCQLCGQIIPKSIKNRKYCSESCRQRAMYYKKTSPPEFAKRNTCRGCRFHVAGSVRCMNKKAKLYGQRYNGWCEKYERMATDD